MAEDSHTLPLTEIAPPELTTYAEPIRLVIWDLDDTFWTGTVTEGGHTYRRDHHDLVVALANRGIMSSICSKNEHAQIKAILEESQLWNYFVFPSINWNPKGPRVKAIIEQMGLRAPTVLFIDDNPQNLHQVAGENPGINIATPDDIAALLTHPQFVGKDDSQLTRLAQYKVLEEKQSLKEEAGDNIEFLRSSDIRVYFDYNTVDNIDRVIELINRTNQLNFTKERVSEDPEEARAQLIPWLKRPGTFSGLVRVVDKFGDYGYVGFYAFNELSAKFYMKHFCFSCRTLNMYIEHFVYNFINRPHLEVKGEVLSDIKAEIDVDWITALPIEQLDTTTSGDVKKIDKMFVRGGCDLMSLCHYFGMNCREITTEFNDIKNWQPRRIDHSSFLYYSIKGLTEAELRAAHELGYDADDFKTAFTLRDKDVYLLSFWADADLSLYRHRETGLELPYFLLGTDRGDLISDTALAERAADRPVHHERIGRLRQSWEYTGPMTQFRMAERFRSFLAMIPGDTPVFMTLANEFPPEHFWQAHKPVNLNHRAYNEVLHEISKDFPNLVLIDPMVYLHSRDDLWDTNHFRRDIYHRIYTDVLSHLP